MSFKESLKSKVKADGLLRELVSTMKEPPGKWWVDNPLIRELVEMTDFKYKKFRDLHLYLRPLKDETMEVFGFRQRIGHLP